MGFFDSKTEPLIQSPEEQSNTRTAQTKSTPIQRDKNRKIARYLVIVTAIFVTAIIVILCYQANEEDASDERTYFSAAGVTLVSCMITAREVYLHLTNWNAPELQKYYLVIWGMVPIYSIFSWLSLRVTDGEVYFEAVKETYEAFVVVAFVRLLVTLMGGREKAIEAVARKDPEIGVHKKCFPICCGKKWEMGEEYFNKSIRGIRQFAYFVVFHAICIMVLQPLDDYEHDLNFTNLFSFLSILSSFSFLWAMYCLVSIEQVFSEDLSSPKNWNPSLKLISFKAIIGITTLQGIIIGLLVDAGVIDDVEGWDADHVGAAMESYLIVIEMVFVAIFFTFTYSYMELLDEEEGYQQVTTDENLYEVNID